MRLLVAGGAGFIGSNFIHYMLDKYPDYEIINFDALTYAGNLDNLETVQDNPHYHFEEGNITDLTRVNEVIEKHKITHLINFAAETHVDKSIHGGIKDFVLTNSLGVQMLLDATRINKLTRMVNVSTDEVYGALALDSDDKFTEDTPIMPNMPYAAAKAGGDLMCNAYWVTHKTPVIVTHCSNNYGPYQFPEKLIPFFIFKAMNDEACPVYGDGLNVRDWIHALDHASALDLLLHKGVDGEVYNIGVDNERNNLEITRMILSILGKSEDLLKFVEDRPGHDRRYAIDSTKILDLGWKPEYTPDQFERGMKETVQWYLDNADWVKKIRARMNEVNQHIAK
jgi:dTDP-glucose 4,6-dehydratase